MKKINSAIMRIAQSLNIIFYFNSKGFLIFQEGSPVIYLAGFLLAFAPFADRV
ncbi:MAG: hypothetical protein KKE12_20190 [Proteobacteria bacterium]|nr:hypothetical protein [Pseudomonadota bacterium]